MKRLIHITAVFLTEPVCRAALSAMLTHIGEHTALAVRVSVPTQERFVNIVLRQFAFRFFLRSVAGKSKITVRAVFGFVGIRCAFCFAVNGKHGVSMTLMGVLIDGRDRHIMLVTELFDIFLQFSRRDAAHIHSATSGDWTGAKVQIQNRGGLFGILAVDFKEIPNLIQHNILRVGGLNGIVLPIRRLLFFRNRSWLGCGNCRDFLNDFTVNDCIGIITLFQLLWGSESPGFHQGIIIFDHLCPRHFNPCAVRLVVANAFSVSPDMAHKIMGKCVISAANAVFVFQEIQLLFGCVW